MKLIIKTLGYVGAAAFLIVILGFAFGMGSKCPDGATYNSFPAVVIAFQASSGNICGHRTKALRLPHKA